MDTRQDASRPDPTHAARRREGGRLRAILTSPPMLCLPLALLGAVGVAFSLTFRVLCYPWMLSARPQLQEIYSPAIVPPVQFRSLAMLSAPLPSTVPASSSDPMLAVLLKLTSVLLLTRVVPPTA